MYIIRGLTQLMSNYCKETKMSFVISSEQIINGAFRASLTEAFAALLPHYQTSQDVGDGKCYQRLIFT